MVLFSLNRNAGRGPDWSTLLTAVPKACQNRWPNLYNFEKLAHQVGQIIKVRQNLGLSGKKVQIRIRLHFCLIYFASVIWYSIYVAEKNLKYFWNIPFYFIGIFWEWFRKWLNIYYFLLSFCKYFLIVVQEKSHKSGWTLTRDQSIWKVYLMSFNILM